MVFDPKKLENLTASALLRMIDEAKLASVFGCITDLTDETVHKRLFQFVIAHQVEKEITYLFDFILESKNNTNEDYNCVVIWLQVKEEGMMRDQWGFTLLHEAVLRRKPKIIQLLISLGANIHECDQFGCTPAMLESNLLPADSDIQNESLASDSLYDHSDDKASLPYFVWVEKNEIKRANVEKRIYANQYATLYKAFWDVQPVAIKAIKNKSHFYKERNIHKELRHPAIQQYYTSFVVPNMVCLVMEHCEDRSLWMMIRIKIYLYQEAIHWLCSIVSGLKYLHGTMNMIHGDLKSENILIFGEVAKLSDFSHVVNLDDQSTYRRKYTGTQCYRAPELLSQSSITATWQMDIYSLGMLMWELSAKVSAWDATEFSPGYEVAAFRSAVIHGLRPSTRRVNSMYASLIPLFQRCWQSNAQQRPTANELLEHLSVLNSSNTLKK